WPARFASSLVSFRFFGAARADGERVDGILHQLAERLVHHAVARDGRLAGKARRGNGEPPVRAAARAVAGVADVLLAFVDQVEVERLERGEALTDSRCDAHLSAGFFSSMYLESTMAWATTNSSISPMPPNSLKFTQLSVE